MSLSCRRTFKMKACKVELSKQENSCFPTLASFCFLSAKVFEAKKTTTVFLRDCQAVGRTVTWLKTSKSRKAPTLSDFMLQQIFVNLGWLVDVLDGHGDPWGTQSRTCVRHH